MLTLFLYCFNTSLTYLHDDNTSSWKVCDDEGFAILADAGTSLYAIHPIDRNFRSIVKARYADLSVLCQKQHCISPNLGDTTIIYALRLRFYAYPAERGGGCF